MLDWSVSILIFFAVTSSRTRPYIQKIDHIHDPQFHKVAFVSSWFLRLSDFFLIGKVEKAAPRQYFLYGYTAAELVDVRS